MIHMGLLQGRTASFPEAGAPGLDACGLFCGL